MVYEIFLLEERHRFDPSGQPRLEFAQGVFNLGGQLAGIETRRLGDGHDDAVGGRFLGGLAHSGVTAHRLDSPRDSGDIGEGDGAVVYGFYDGAGEFAEVGRHGEVANHDLGWAGVDEPARGVAGGVSDGGFELGETNVVGLHPIRIGLDLDLFHAAAHIEDLSDARDALQATLNRPIRESPYIARRQVTRLTLRHGGADADEQNLAHERGHGRHERLRAGG